jgi:hypothetical protein
LRLWTPVLAVAAACAAGCGSSTAPSPAVVDLNVTTTGSIGNWEVGDSRQLTATARLSNGSIQDVTAQASWVSSATTVLTVSAAGLATAAGPGEAEARATYQGMTGRLPVIVAPPMDRVVVQSASPSPQTVLVRGQRVTFTFTVGYTLASADCGDVAMIIQDQGTRLLASDVPSADVTRGRGSVTLTADSVLIPEDATRVRVFLALFPCGATSTEAVELTSYTVR